MVLFFRKWLTSWPVLALLSLVLVAFVVTGVKDPFGGGSAVGTPVATVGKTQISENALLAAFDQALKRVRANDPSQTAQSLARQGAMPQVLDQLIATTSLEQYAAKVGVSISDLAVDGEIASIEAFQSNGKFDQVSYRRILADQRITERQLRDDFRGGLVRKQLLTPVVAGMQVSSGLAKPYAALLLDLRQGQIALLPLAIAADPGTPTAAQLSAYYAEHKSRYMLPERRSFRYAMIDRSAIAEAVVLTDSEISSYFDQNREKLGAVETRKLSQVVVSDQAKAQAIVAAARAGKSFANAATRLGGFSAADIDLGTLSQAKFAGATNTAIAAAAFKSPLHSISEPIKSDFGWHVVSVDAIYPPRVQSITAARDIIAAQLRTVKTEDALVDMVAKIEDGFADGESFADIAKQFKLTLVAVPAITRDGNAAGFALAPAAVPLIAKAFDAELGDSATVQEIAVAATATSAKTVQYAVLELGDITRSSPPPLPTISALITSAWAADARLGKLRDLSRMVIADTKKGITLSASLASHHLPAAQPIAGRQIDVARQGNVAPPVQLFLTSPKGVAQMLESPGGIFIVQVASITAGDTAPFPQIVDASRRQLASLVGEEISGAFARAAEREVGITRNEARLADATKRILGEDAAAAQ